MFTTVDNRVVQMRFDNEEFEKKAHKSISTLDKLKNALKFSGASKNLDDVNKSFKEVDANPLLKAIEGVNGGLTTMVAKATVVNRATNALIDTTKRFVSSMTLDQVNAGWDKYAEKTSAVQTIMSATSKDFKDTGTQMNYVNNQLEKLNWFTDETSYNFTDMVGNIGKFTSNGIKLDKSVTAMQGIALWAARSGANAGEASRAMYNLSQALSTGAVKLIDWKSIENANMATAEFKENAIETAVALGKLKKTGDGVYKTMQGNAVSVTNFNSALSDSWLTSDVLIKVLDKYGSFTNKLYEVSEATDLTATQLLAAIDKYADGTLDLQAYANSTGVDVEELRGYLDELSSSTYELGRKSFQAGQEAKTFAEAISATSDAVSTGWMKTFELIFGDYEEAKKLWTSLANILYEVFAASGDVRNELFGEWREGGGRKTLLEGINESMEAILRLVTPFKDAFRDIFPAKTSQDLLNITAAFKKLATSLQLNSKQMTNIRRIMRGVFSVFDIFLTVLKSVGNAVKDLIAPQFSTFGDMLLAILATIGDLIYAFRNFIRSSDKISVSFGKVGEFASSLLEILKKLFDQFRSSAVGQVSFKIIQNVFVGAAKAASDLLNYVKEVVSRIASLDRITFANLIGIFKGIGVDAQNWFKNLNFNITDSDGILDKFQNSVKTACSQVGMSFDNLQKNTDKVFTTIKNLLEKIPWASIVSIAFGMTLIHQINKFVTAMSGVGLPIESLAKSLNKLLGSITGMFNAIKNSINVPTYAKIAKAIAILAVSIGLLALLPSEKVEIAALSLAGVITAFLLFILVLGKLPNVSKTAMSAVKVITACIAGLAISMIALASAFKLLEEVDPNKLIDSTLAIGTLVGVLVFAAAQMNSNITRLSDASGKIKSTNTAAKNLLVMSASIFIIAKALESISDIKFKDPASAIIAITAAVISVASLSVMIGKMKATDGFKNSAALMLGILSITAMFRTLEKLGEVKITNLGNTIKNAIIVIAALGGLFAVTRLAGENAGKAGKLMSGLGIGILALMGAMILLGKMDETTVKRGINAIGYFTIIMMGLMVASSAVGENAHKVSVTLLAAAAAIGVLAIISGIVGVLDDGQMMKGVVYIGVLSLFLDGLILVTSKATDATKTIGALTVAMVALGVMIASLTFAMKDGPDKLMAASLAMSAMMVCFGVMGKLVSTIEKINIASVGILVVLTGLLATILGGFLALAPNLDMAIPVATSIAILMAALIPAMAAITMASTVGAVAAAALPALGIAVAAIAVILTAIGVLRNLIPDDLPDKCLIIGEAIGNLIGGLAGGVFEGAITTIGKGIQAFADSVSGIDFAQVLSAINSIVKFGEALLVLSALDLGARIVGKANLDKFGESLSGLGAALTEYSVAIQNANISKIIASTPAVTALANVASALPKTGGLVQFFDGQQDLSKFAEGITAFGYALTEYSIAVSSCNNAAIVASVASAAGLVAIANQIPDWGVLGIFFGQQSLSTFGMQLLAFGAALTAYSGIVSLCNVEAINASLPAVQSLVAIANQIPNWSIFGMFFGKQSFAVFGEQLRMFGESLVKYSKSVTNVDPAAILASAYAAKALVEVAKALPDDGIIQWVQGKQGLDDFGDKLEDFGKSLAKYYTAIGGVTIDSTQTSLILANLNRIIDFMPNIANLDMAGLVSFSDKLTDFSGGLIEFFGDVATIESPTPLDLLCQNVVSSIASLNLYVDEFKKAGEDCVAGFLQGVAGDDALTQVSTSGETLGTKFLLGFRTVTGWHSPWTTMISAAWDAVRGLFSGVKEAPADDVGGCLAEKTLDGYDKVADGAYEGKAADAANELAAGAVKNGDTAESAGSYLGSRMLQGMEGSTKDLTGWAKKQVAKVKEVKDEYADSTVNSLLDMVGLRLDTEETNAAASEMQSALEDTISAATTGASGAYSSAGTKAADTFLTAFETKLSDLDLDLSTIDLEQELWEATIGQTASETDKNAKETEVIKKKIEIQNEKVDQANQKYEYIVKKMGKTSEDAKKAYQELLQEQIDLANLMNQVNEARSSVANNSTDAMVAYAQYIAESKDDLLKLGFTMEQISAAAAERTGYNLQNTTQNMTDSVTGAVQTAMSTVSSTYAATAESTIGALTTNFESYGVKYAESLGNGMATTTGAVTTGAKALANAGTTAISGDYQQWYNLGVMCAEGFKQGILSKAKEIADAAAAIANAAFDATQIAIDSHSPSRKFMWLGEMSGEGFALGFENMTNRVAHSSEEMSQGAIDAARETIKQIAEVIDTDPTLHPQIAPVVDLMNAKTGLNKLNVMKTPVITTYVTGARVSAVASSLNQQRSNINQQVPQNNQNGPQVVEFVQNNYSPKALSRSEIYRNTNNQFTAFKEAISRV